MQLEEEEGAKKRKIKEKQKREADKAIDKRNKEEEEKRKKKKTADTTVLMSSGRINAMLSGKSKNKAGTFDMESDLKAGKDAEDLITNMTEAAQKDRDLYKAKRPALNKLLMAP